MATGSRRSCARLRSVLSRAPEPHLSGSSGGGVTSCSPLAARGSRPPAVATLPPRRPCPPRPLVPLQERIGLRADRRFCPRAGRAELNGPAAYLECASVFGPGDLLCDRLRARGPLVVRLVVANGDVSPGDAGVCARPGARARCGLVRRIARPALERSSADADICGLAD